MDGPHENPTSPQASRRPDPADPAHTAPRSMQPASLADVSLASSVLAEAAAADSCWGVGRRFADAAAAKARHLAQDLGPSPFPSQEEVEVPRHRHRIEQRPKAPQVMQLSPPTDHT